MPELLATVSQFILAIALPYLGLTLFLGVRVARRQGGDLRAQERGGGAGPDAPPGYFVYFMVPCLNEERVVGASVDSLLNENPARIVVIDDGSDDRTAEMAREAARARDHEALVLVVSRHLPDARRGKGPALNAGFQEILVDVRARGLDPDKVVIAVMDADGRFAPGGIGGALRLFERPEVGAVQLSVRIRTRQKLIQRFQDVEFWMISALSQFARTLSGTVSLGGNGQFTRLSALLGLNGDPWSESLTEDLDLGLRLLAAGWEITTTMCTYVDQQGVDGFRRLLRQRTRWYQGHMTCITRLPEMWRSNRLRQLAFLEVSSYLLVPWILVLPWSLVQEWILYEICLGAGRGVVAGTLGSVSWRVTYGLLWYCISFLPNLMVGFFYARRTRDVSLGQALLLGHLLLLWNYVGYLAAWRALVRMIRGRTGWDKTARSIEAPLPVAGV